MQADARARLQRALADLSAGNRDAFDDVFTLAWPMLRALALRTLANEAEAEDAAQRALLKLFSNASRFDSKRDALPWTLTFVLNEIRSVRNRRRRRPIVSLEHDLQSDAEPETELLRADLVHAVHSIVGTLDARDRAALGLEPSGVETVCPATRRKRKQRALDRLRMAWRRMHGIA